MTREALKITSAANYAETMPDYVDGNYVRGLKEGYKKGWEDADENPKNPWRDAKNDPPRLTINVIVYYNGWIGEGFYLKSSDTWIVLDRGSVNVEYWMPTPELLKINEK